MQALPFEKRQEHVVNLELGRVLQYVLHPANYESLHIHP
jgi:hypothetical protein